MWAVPEGMVQSTGLAITFVYSHRKRPISTIRNCSRSVFGLVSVKPFKASKNVLFSIQLERYRAANWSFWKIEEWVHIDTCYFSSIPMSPKKYYLYFFSWMKCAILFYHYYLYLCRNYVNFVPNYRIWKCFYKCSLTKIVLIEIITNIILHVCILSC